MLDALRARLFRGRRALAAELAALEGEWRKSTDKLKKTVQRLRRELEEVYSQYSRLLNRFHEVSDQDPAGGATEPAPVPAAPPEGRRLNVGCGRVKKPGFLNVDLDPSAAPEVVLDLERPLPFAPEAFQQVEGYHVIEHVHPWLAPRVLDEFYRVLKPGGQVVLECPNLEFACAWLLAGGGYGLDSQLGMWALYGDPHPRNPANMHRWGYVPLTLSRLLRDAGFVEVRREQPETHVARRDLRMVGRKPAPR